MTAPGSTDTRSVALDANVDAYTRNMDLAAAATDRVASGLDSLSGKVSNLSQRAGKRLFQLSAADGAALTGAVATAGTFERQLSTLNATAAVTGQRFGGLKGAVESTFQKFPVARADVVALVQTITSLGVTGPRAVAQLTASFTKMGAATGEPVQALAQGLLMLDRQMGGSSAGKVAQYASAIVDLSKNAGVSASGMLQFAQGIAPIARTAGIGTAAVLGISTAFSKAGADGFVAANTFNSIVGNITQMTQTGSPELAKYANVIGKTADEFAKMDKTTAITQLFTTIAKQGPEAIGTLNRLGIDGVRAQSAISAVVQSGDLQGQVTRAMNSSTNTSALDKGSKAAFGGLDDSLANLRNNFTQFGTQIGTTFLRPIDAAVTGVNKLFGAFNRLTAGIAPVLGVLGVVGGAVSGVAGVALSSAGLVGGLALARLGLRPARALVSGARAGQGPAPAGMGRVSNVAYGLGQRFGNTGLGARLFSPSAGGATSGLTSGQAARMFLAAPLRSARYLANDQAAFLNDARQRGLSQGEMRRRMNMGLSPTPSLRERITNRAYPNERGPMGIGRRLAADAGSTGSLRLLGQESAKLTGAFVRLGAETTRAGLAIAGGKVGRGLGALGSFAMNPMVLLGAMGLSAGVGAARRSRAEHAGFTDDDFNPLQKYNDALGIATGKVNTFASVIGNATQAAGGGSGTGASAAATTYSQATVGSSDVAAFAGKGAQNKAVQALKVGDTAGALSLARSMGMSDPRQLQAYAQDLLRRGYSADDVNKIVNQYAADPTAGADYGQLGSVVAGAQGRGGKSWINSLTGTAGNTSDAGKAAGGSALAGISNQFDADNQRYGGTYASQRRIQSVSQYFAGLGTFDAEGQTRAGGAAKTAQAQAFIDQYKQFTGEKSPSSLDAVKVGDRSVWNILTDQTSTPQQRQQAILQAINATTGGANSLGAKNNGALTLDPSKMNSVLSLNMTGASTYNDQIRTRGGALGSFVVGTPGSQLGPGQAGPTYAATPGNKMVQDAMQRTEDPQAQFRAQQELARQAMALGGGFGAAVTALEKLKGAAGSASDPLYQLASAAQQYVQQQHQQFEVPTMSRPQQVSDALGQYKTAVGNLDSSPDAVANAQSAEQNFRQVQEQQRQYMIGVLQQVRAAGVAAARAEEDGAKARYRSQRDFGIQMVQAEQDFDTSRYRQQRDFNTSMERAQDDYEKTVMRSERDFNISRTQSDQDFQKQRYRSQRDFDISQARAAQTAAQSIYDPFKRVQAQYVADAGTLLQNLQDQNERIAKQYEQLNTLKQAGLSQQSIDTLNLSDPGQAQQLNALVNDLSNNPALINQINQQVAMRLQGTTQLTQSSFSMSFRNTVEDFTRQLQDTADDYQVAQQRAAEAQNRALNDMATDYGITQARATADQAKSVADMEADFTRSQQRASESQRRALSDMANDFATAAARARQDLATAMTEIYGDFGSVYAQTINAINQYTGSLGTNLATQLKNSLASGMADVSTFMSLYNQALIAMHVPPINADIMARFAQGIDYFGGSYTSSYHGRASGGPINANQTYMVGENGPELFSSTQTGYITDAETTRRIMNDASMKTMGVAGRGMMPQATTSSDGAGTWLDQSTNITGPISVYAADLSGLLGQFRDQQRYTKLGTPGVFA